MRRAVPLVLALAGCILLAVAEFSNLYEIKVITVTVNTGTVGDHHGYALLIVAIAAAAMTWFSVIGGSRAAGFALLALSVVALVVVFAVDLPVVDDTGLWGERYERAGCFRGDRVLPGDPRGRAAAARRGGEPHPCAAPCDRAAGSSRGYCRPRLAPLQRSR